MTAEPWHLSTPVLAALRRRRAGRCRGGVGGDAPDVLRGVPFLGVRDHPVG